MKINNDLIGKISWPNLLYSLLAQQLWSDADDAVVQGDMLHHYQDSSWCDWCQANPDHSILLSGSLEQHWNMCCDQVVRIDEEMHFVNFM